MARRPTALRAPVVRVDREAPARLGRPAPSPRRLAAAGPCRGVDRRLATADARSARAGVRRWPGVAAARAGRHRQLAARTHAVGRCFLSRRLCAVQEPGHVVAAGAASAAAPGGARRHGIHLERGASGSRRTCRRRLCRRTARRLRHQAGDADGALRAALRAARAAGPTVRAHRHHGGRRSRPGRRGRRTGAAASRRADRGVRAGAVGRRRRVGQSGWAAAWRGARRRWTLCALAPGRLSAQRAAARPAGGRPRRGWRAEWPPATGTVDVVRIDVRTRRTAGPAQRLRDRRRRRLGG